MAWSDRRGAAHRRLVAIALLLGWASALVATGNGPTASTALAAGWSGGIDLYRPGVFTTQQSWLWCTAADVQIARNIVFRGADHSASGQRRYFDWMRARNRYPIPLSDGVDPAGWAAGMRNFVDGRYRLVESPSFGALLRSAVTNLRRTNRPVGLFVAHGDHAWLLTGFTATADPAATSAFTVTSVRVVGPLYGLQSRSYGYDMPPDTTLTPSQLAGFVTPWHYPRIRMIWEGHFISIQPVASSAGTPPVPPPTRGPTATTHAAPTLAAAASPRPSPSAARSASASPSAAASSDSSAGPSAGEQPFGPSAAGSVAPASPEAAVAGSRAESGPGSGSGSVAAALGVLVVGALAALVVGARVTARSRSAGRTH